MCTKQTSVSLSSKESEIISLDAGFRIDGVPALELWDLVTDVLHFPTTGAWGNPWHNNQKKLHITQDDSELVNVDYVSAYAQSSQSGATLYMFEDNEAAIKMIIKGRSPMTRHASQTHRVALDWLFDRINLDPEIQTKHIDTKHQLADMLIKGNFTRDEWNNLLHLLNISNLSSVCCFQFFSSTSCPKTMSKRLQEGEREKERVLAKSKPMINLVSENVARSPMMPSSSASGSPGTLRARNQNLDLPSSTEKPVARDTDKNTARALKRCNRMLNGSTGRPVATGKTQIDTGRRWQHNLWVSDVGYLGKVNSDLR